MAKCRMAEAPDGGAVYDYANPNYASSGVEFPTEMPDVMARLRQARAEGREGEAYTFWLNEDESALVAGPISQSPNFLKLVPA